MGYFTSTWKVNQKLTLLYRIICLESYENGPLDASVPSINQLMSKIFLLLKHICKINNCTKYISIVKIWLQGQNYKQSIYNNLLTLKYSMQYNLWVKEMITVNNTLYHFQLQKKKWLFWNVSKISYITVIQYI